MGMICQGTASLNKKVAACARFARSGEHGAERRAGNFWNVKGKAQAQITRANGSEEKRVPHPWSPPWRPVRPPWRARPLADL